MSLGNNDRSPFSAIENVDSLQPQKEFFEEEGDYICMLESVYKGVSENPDHLNATVCAHSIEIVATEIQGEVIETSREAAERLKTLREKELLFDLYPHGPPRKPGEIIRWTQYLDTEFALKRVKNLIAAVENVTQNQVTEQMSLDFYRDDGANVVDKLFRARVTAREADSGTYFNPYFEPFHG